ncbi:MAG TPA: ketose-bisphosphate aldolase, partial [Patescibacteria group bacterium]|nr:ketose-bisphosphate aldolase [Patescibacteria group bacterium]
KFLYHLMLAANELYPELPIVLHQDHGSVEACISAVDLGYTSVMIDGSLKEDHKTPASYDENVKVTKEVVEYAHARGVSVEAELGVIGGIEDGAGTGDMKSEYLTDPDQAVEFVKETGVDALAVAVGTSHGVYKFTKEPDGSVLVMDRIVEIHKRLPHTHLVMHGSSSVPQDLLAIVNKYGGQIKPTWGVPVEEIQKGIQHGVRKVNVDTDIRLAMTGAIRKYLTENPGAFDPRDYLKPAREAVIQLLSERMKAFGQAGHAGDYQPISLEEAKGWYK